MIPNFKEMAREWFGDVHGGVLNAYASALQSAYEAGQKDERERCAGIAAEKAGQVRILRTEYDAAWQTACEVIAAAIREDKP